MHEKLQALAMRHADIARWLRNEVPLEEIIASLATQIDNLTLKVMDLQLIASKKNNRQ